MNTPARMLIADDNPANLDIFRTRLSSHGYDILTASNGEEALAVAREQQPDLILLDVMMPKMDGIEVCKRLKQDKSLPFMPIILVTARTDPKDVVQGLEAGAEEYLTKPIDQTALIARIKSMLRIKALNDTNLEQAARLQEQAEELAGWNRDLEKRVAEQLAELERLGELKQFFSPQVVERLISTDREDLLKSHRREITALFCDLRGFTAFAEDVEPEEVMQVLREYYEAIGALIYQFEATVEHFTGDGLLAYFNAPETCPDPAVRAVRMALAMQRDVGALAETWRRRGYDLGLGVGIALGYATLGQIGFKGRFHYGAIGPVLNLASRLCSTASSGRILVTQRIAMDVGGAVSLESVGDLELKGFHKPVPTFNVTGSKSE
jgi:class 3 adenylate cyclase/CheY-like chemotaxis protein